MRRSLRSVLLLLVIAILSADARLSYAADDSVLAFAIQRILDRSAPDSGLPALDPANRAILTNLYAERGFAAFWVHGGKPTAQALALLTQLHAADTYGLRPQDYSGPLLTDLLERTGLPQRTARPQQTERVDRSTLSRDLDPERLALFDVALSAQASRFLQHLHSGRVTPSAVGFKLTGASSRLDIANLISRLANAPDLSEVIASAEPNFYHYRLLRAALTHYRALAAQPGLSDLPAFPGRAIKPGQSYSGALALRRLLLALGDFTDRDAASDESLVLDSTLVAALKRFQQRHGIEADGALGRSTFAALTTPLAVRVRQIELTLERWRWLPAFETPPIIVNIPQFRLFAFRSTQDLKADILQMDVIVGRSYPRMRTPVFEADMKYVVFRPYWDIPYSILTHEILPQVHARPSYLSAQHLQIVRGASDIAEIMPPTPANIDALASRTLRLRQEPGPDNPLGLIKFMLPNPYDVYLHSTPARALFSQSRRDFSHGCIRVSDPVALAAHVLQGVPGEWTPEAIQAAMNGETTFRVTLAKPIRVLILYGTALATESGTILFFNDLYGHDRKLESLLHLPPVPLNTPARTIRAESR